MSMKEVKLINIHLSQIGKLLKSTKFSYPDLCNLEAFLVRALEIVRATLDKVKKEELH